jgi:hypothetical protein
MVLEYLPTFTRTKSPNFVGKYTSTMEHMGIDVDNVPIKSGRAESCQIGAKF